MAKRQCKACPWKVSTVPERDIPGGYCVEKHKGLAATVADPANPKQLLSRKIKVMACHESDPERPFACVGWLANQLGRGNNLALRLMVLSDPSMADFELDGPQHETIEDTLPKGKT